MPVKALLLGIAVLAPAFAEWPRLVIYEKGIRIDQPESQPLVAFTDFPWRRSDGDVCYPCAPQDLERAKSQKAHTDLRSLGIVNGLQVYDLLYYRRDEPEVAMKSILVQTAPNVYHEIYHDEPNEGKVNPSFIVTAGNDQLVCVLDNVYRWDGEDDCFLPEANGVVRLDFKPAWDAAQRVFPSGRKVWAHGIAAKSTFERMVLRVGMPTEGRNSCCGRGVANVRFRLERGRVVVIDATFDANAEYHW